MWQVCMLDTYYQDFASRAVWLLFYLYFWYQMCKLAILNQQFKSMAVLLLIYLHFCDRCARQPPGTSNLCLEAYGY